MTQLGQESVITDEVRAMIGKPSDPVTLEAEKGAIVKCARAVDDLNPMYVDEEAAKGMRHGGLIAHPGYVYYLWFNLLSKTAGRSIVTAVKFGQRAVHGGDEFEFYEPIRPGDTIAITQKLANIRETTGRQGKLLITTTQNDFWNQHNRKVAVLRTIVVQM